MAPGSSPLRGCPGPRRPALTKGASLLTTRITHNPARRLEVEGGTAARVLDFTAEAEVGAIIIWHSDDPAFPADGVCVRVGLALPPPGTSWDLRCDDCASEVVTLVGV